MPRGNRAGGRGGQGAARGRVTKHKPRRARSLSFATNAKEPTPGSSVEPTPGPSDEPTPGPSAKPTPGPSVEPTPGPSVERPRYHGGGGGCYRGHTSRRYDPAAHVCPFGTVCRHAYTGRSGTSCVKPRTQFSPSTGNVQATVLPQDPVLAEIELVGFTPC
ncbi:unnamed protein product [Diatraea saccharalis]|uniref:Uncharacterized protein n=1 Tax=Diatraea saccharalis TaxID=40085 RepID=A0A9N9QPQ7_9NEOP|nr:unnamed protein product [Diatraea saccharalis]